ncbi:MAG: metal-dependent hydrolase, partial [Gammaproteobacteria bacterium]
MPRARAHAPTQLSLFDVPATLPHDEEPAAPAIVDAFAPPPAFRHPRARREVELGGHRVAYALRRARRRSIGFVVGAEGLTVSAPRWVGVGEIDAALRTKADWVLRKLH